MNRASNTFAIVRRHSLRNRSMVIRARRGFRIALRLLARRARLPAHRPAPEPLATPVVDRLVSRDRADQARNSPPEGVSLRSSSDEEIVDDGFPVAFQDATNRPLTLAKWSQ
jgi:hypothetical protein